MSKLDQLFILERNKSMQGMHFPTVFRKKRELLFFYTFYYL